MNIQQWKQDLVTEIETAAEWRAEKAVVDPDDPRIARGQALLFGMADQLKAMPADHESLVALYDEETELANIAEAEPEEAEQRYRDSKEQILQAIGFDHEPFENVDQFLVVLRNMVDETITEYRLR